MRSAVVFVHIVAATLALIAGLVATRRPNGTPVHRRAGRVYVLSWVCFASTGLWLGAARAAISPFEILTILGALALMVALLAIRRKQLFGAWMFWLMVAAPFFVLPPVVGRLRARFPVADRS